MLLSWLFSDPLPVGSKAPPFVLPDEQGSLVSLEQLRGKNVVLVWYPGDDTMVCRQQLCEFRDRWQLLQNHNIVVFGINPQGAESHARFRQKHRFPFPLLVDEGQKVGRLYRTNGLIVKRTVYLIGKDGIIRYARRGKPSVDEVLAAADR
ncbi:MAG: peroxiredoxin [Bryobacteraceae bacterium]|nr:peroxiredoxin [Bryobacteraceae bacterium]MDW8377884.1 peroxiredoxin [Bryobacterales bacterium]